MIARLSRFAPLFLLPVLACSSGETTEPAAQPIPSAMPAAAPGQPVQPTAPPGSKVFFIDPQDGATVKGALVDGKVAVTVKMGVEGIGLEPAGAQKQGSGHHHIIVDGDFVAVGSIVPKDETHLHYGQAQSEATVALTPGEHKLSMQFADGAHMSYGPQLAASIQIKVEADPNAPAAKSAP
jgi:hypothetical protein